MLTGKCNCGAVEYIADVDVTDVFLCHCSICRSSTGSGGIAVVIIQTSDFKWLKGQDSITYWSKPGHDWHTSFCKVCGSSLPGKNDEYQTYIPVGTLTSGDENLKVAHHLYVGSKAAFEVIGDSGVQHIEGFGSKNA